MAAEFGKDEIATRRLLLTPLRPEDAEPMAGVLADERLHEFIGGSPASADELRSRYRRLAAGSRASMAQLDCPAERDRRARRHRPGDRAPPPRTGGGSRRVG